MITDEKAEAACDFIKHAAADFAKSKAERHYLEEFRKSKKALLMKKYLTQGCDAVGAQEREAYADQEYIQILDGIKAAIEIEEKLKWQLTAADLQIRIWQTQSANDRKGI